VINVAARFGALAFDGAILVSKATAERVKEHFSPTSTGKFRLKNISEEVEVFAL
jgi:class 3 adenylate cyclase